MLSNILHTVLTYCLYLKLNFTMVKQYNVPVYNVYRMFLSEIIMALYISSINKLNTETQRAQRN